MNLRSYLDFATETAWLAGKLTLGYFQTGVHADMKADDSPVTVADREAEKLIRGRIESYFPDHSIVGEEFENKETTSSHRWFIDPIDGTKSFISGVPFYAVLLGLEIDGRIEVGVAYYPGIDEILAAGTGEGCHWNGKRTHVSEMGDLSRATVCYTAANSFAKFGRQTAWDTIKQKTWIQRGWGDAYGYLLVATGRAHIMLDPIMEPYDCSPFPAIFREAGGYCGDWRGNETIYASELMATNRQLLPQLLEMTGDVEKT